MRLLRLDKIAIGAALLGLACDARYEPDGPELVAECTSALVVNEYLIYGDELSQGWDWESESWGVPGVSTAATSPVYDGAAAMAVPFDQGYAGLVLNNNTPFDVSKYGAIRFWIHGGSTSNRQITFKLRNDAGTWLRGVPVTVNAGQWKQIDIPLSSLDSPTRITSLLWKESGGSSQPVFHLDRIAFVLEDIVVYDDALAPGWQNSSQGATVDLGATAQVKHGNTSLAATLGSGAAILALQTATPVDISKYEALRFWIHGGSAGGQGIQLQLRNGAGTLGPSVPIKGIARNWWTRVDLPVRDLLTSTSPAQITGLVFTAPGGASQPTFYLDQISFVTGCLPLPGPAQVGEELVVYDDARAPGWQSWSWNTDPDKEPPEPVSLFDFAATAQVQSGTRSISVKFNAGYHGLYLHSVIPIDSSRYDHVRFWIHGGSTGDRKLTFYLRGVNNPDTGSPFDGEERSITASANEWTEFQIPLEDLVTADMHHVVTGIIWQEELGQTQPTFYVDRISFVRRYPAPPPAPPELHVDVAAGRHAISPYIYGINDSPTDTKDGKIEEAMARELRLPVRRWGGNAATRYNYQEDITNVGSDWYFENVRKTADPNAGSAANRFVLRDKATDTESLLTVPLIGWVASEANHPQSELACSFSVPTHGPQKDVDAESRPDCGNGVRLQDNTPITLTDEQKRVASRSIDPSFVRSWVSDLVLRHGRAEHGGVAFYNLDNEPALWNDTHRDVHPEPVGYDELAELTELYAAAIKAADPTAKTLGPVAWGWNEYFYSAKDQVVTEECVDDGKDDWWECLQDRNAHGGVALVPWYLQQMRDYELQNDLRILDYLDLHYYPEAKGLARRPAGCPSIQALRLRSTRSLWDPYYTDESWINEEPIRLIPRMKRWVANNYPGTMLAITEYNFGALDHINGALTQADVLGIFGREGLDLATLWWYSDENQPTFDLSHPAAFSFRMYRNYDGQGNGFGDMSVKASSSDQDRLAVYAAERLSDRALTLIVINKTGESLTSSLALNNFSPLGSAQVFRYSEANLGAIVREADQPVTGSGFTATYPANSITLFVLAAGQATGAISATPQTVFVTAGGRGTSRICWNVDNIATGEVWMRLGDPPDMLFAQGPSGCKDLSDIPVNNTYVFRLYGGTTRNTLLASVTVTGVAFEGIDWFDTTPADRDASGWPVAYRDQVSWDHANRSANDLCHMRGYAAGRYVGHQLWDLMGVHCYRNDTVHGRTATLEELWNTNGWGSATDISQPHPLWANHAATAYCAARGDYEAGFFAGHQSENLVGVNCITADRVTLREELQRNTSFPQSSPEDWEWWELNIAANEECGRHGHQTGQIIDYYGSYLGTVLKLRCID